MRVINSETNLSQGNCCVNRKNVFACDLRSGTARAAANNYAN